MKVVKGPDPQRRELAYCLLNGLIEAGDGGIQRSDGYKQIAFLVGKIYQHRFKLSNRAGLEFEDEDLEAIVATYEKLNRLCAELMYNQGWHDANQGV